MPITLYFDGAAPSSRIALAVAKAVGVDVIVKKIDLASKEHLREDYLKLNPQHTVPTLIDNDFILWDSHAIATYLASQYGKDDSLYPKDPKKRAVVIQRLFFNEGVLYSRLRAVGTPLYFGLKTTVDRDKKDALYEALDFLEKFLERTGWVAGDHATIADIACAVTASSIEAIGADLSGFPKTRDWLGRCRKSIRGFREADDEGARFLGETIRGRLQPHQLDR
ncbi:glutathione S-transferase 1-like [Schistocerca cancellata]|uniref:glutathione S-transferase 1-like n=1 Tax=Schistocerca cancellata TaxID=274614 RepID=UPI0021189CFE|nr:glutathione S-transferase 1-like [Schistocerca cancellata]